MKNSKEIIAQDSTVLVGVDVHTAEHVVAVKVDGEIVCKGVKIAPMPEEWERFMKRFPGCEVHVVYESGAHGYNLRDWLVEMGGEMKGVAIFVHIAPPCNVPVVPGKRGVKTDRRDGIRLIQAFEMRSFDDVVVPDKLQRAQRELVRTRLQFKAEEKRLKLQIHGQVKFHGIERPICYKMWSDGWRKELVNNARLADGTGVVAMSLRMKLKILREVEKVVEVVEKKIEGLYRSDSSSGQRARKIAQQSGIGLTSAMVIATEVADFRAFRNSEAFASYIGLVPGERSSGETVRRGSITKAGNRRLRWIFVECAWAWVRCSDAARSRYERLRGRRGKRKAIVAMARRLAVRVYHSMVSEVVV
ncbi:MAG: IS110 family transposase [bacterium]